MFLVLMSLELLAGFVFARKCVYRFNDFMGSLSSGTSQQLFGALASKIIRHKRMYALVHDNCSILSVDVRERPTASWVLLMILSRQCNGEDSTPSKHMFNINQCHSYLNDNEKGHPKSGIEKPQQMKSDRKFWFCLSDRLQIYESYECMK